MPSSADKRCSSSAASPSAVHSQPQAHADAETRRELPWASILVVEDDPPSARLIAAYLHSAGYRVSIANSAAEAQESIERALPDLILCDVCLPDMNGIQLTSWVRGRFGAVNLPIALITSSDDSKILSQGLDSGADDFLAKPINSLELRTRVRSLLRNKVFMDEIRARERAALPFADDRRASHEYSAENTQEVSLPLAIVVEDNAQERRLLESHLNELGFTTLGADGVETGLELAGQRLPDLIVLDLLLPGRSGYEFIESLKADPQASHVPILVVSAMSEVRDRVKALEAGADDFIVKGFERVEFQARVRRLLRLKNSIDELNRRCSQALRMAISDSLTGLYTYGFMKETLQSQLGSAQRYGYSYSVIFADIDRFKQINDRYGHAAGDAVLRAVAHSLASVARQSDTLVRYGGEEFVVLLPHTSRADALTLAERMREAVDALKISGGGGSQLETTMSLGVAAYPEDAADAETLVQRSDDAMYLAKQSGRNCVMTCANESTVRSATARVLLVDDDEKNLRLLEAYLAPEGYQLLYARDGVEAIELACKQRPDIIIMDELMPRLSGCQACQRLKQDPKTRLLPIVLASSLNTREDKLRGIEAGADDFLTKPIDKDELLARIRALVRQKRGTDVLEDAETVIFALARAVEHRDPLLANHVERVAHYAVGLGRALGLGERDLEALRRAGIVHDIGKIAIPDSILLKPGALTPEERQVIQQHVETGYHLLESLRTFGDALPAVRFHHERLDGSGYPLGLRGPEVPLLAQIMAIADVYDALTAPRRYREVMSADAASEILRDEAQRGLHDSELVEAFLTRVATLSVKTDAGVAEGHELAAAT